MDRAPPSPPYGPTFARSRPCPWSRTPAPSQCSSEEGQGAGCMHESSHWVSNRGKRRMEGACTSHTGSATGRGGACPKVGAGRGDGRGMHSVPGCPGLSLTSSSKAQLSSSSRRLSRIDPSSSEAVLSEFMLRTWGLGLRVKDLTSRRCEHNHKRYVAVQADETSRVGALT